MTSSQVPIHQSQMTLSQFKTKFTNDAHYDNKSHASDWIDAPAGAHKSLRYIYPSSRLSNLILRSSSFTKYI